MKGKLIHGHTITSYPETLDNHEPYITMKRLGSEDPEVFFAPDEARTFGKALIEAQEYTEGGSRSILLSYASIDELLAYIDYLGPSHTLAPNEKQRAGAKVRDILSSICNARKG